MGSWRAIYMYWAVKVLAMEACEIHSVTQQSSPRVFSLLWSLNQIHRPLVHEYLYRQIRYTGN